MTKCLLPRMKKRGSIGPSPRRQWHLASDQLDLIQYSSSRYRTSTVQYQLAGRILSASGYDRISSDTGQARGNSPVSTCRREDPICISSSSLLWAQVGSPKAKYYSRRRRFCLPASFMIFSQASPVFTEFIESSASGKLKNTFLHFFTLFCKKVKKV